MGLSAYPWGPPVAPRELTQKGPSITLGPGEGQGVTPKSLPPTAATDRWVTPGNAPRVAFPRTAAPRICCRTLKQSSLSVGFHPQNECSGTCRKGERAPRSLHNSSTQESTKNTFLVKSEIQNVPREPGSTQAHESCPEARRPEAPVHLTGRGGVPSGHPPDLSQHGHLLRTQRVTIPVLRGRHEGSAAQRRRTRSWLGGDGDPGASVPSSCAHESPRGGRVLGVGAAPGSTCVTASGQTRWHLRAKACKASVSETGLLSFTSQGCQRGRSVKLAAPPLQSRNEETRGRGRSKGPQKAFTTKSTPEFVLNQHSQ